MITDIRIPAWSKWVPDAENERLSAIALKRLEATGKAEFTLDEIFAAVVEVATEEGII